LANLFVLCEKNTQQANPFAKALLGRTTRNSDGFYEGHWRGKTVVIGYLGGHLYEQYQPADYTPAWSAREAKPYDLVKAQPLIPNEWKIKEKKGKVGKQTIHELLMKVKKWGKQAQEIYLATDPDREGTLLGQEVLRELGLMDKVTKRVYVNDMAESQIKKSFEQAKAIDQDYLLYQAGLERQRVDWLGGIASFALIKSENILQGRKQKGTGSIGRVKSGVAIFIHQVNEKIDYWDEEAPENNKYGLVMKTSDGLVLKSERQAPREGQARSWIKKHEYITQTMVNAKDSLRQVNAPMFFQLSDIQAWAKQNKINKDIMPFLNNLALKGYITYPRTSINVISSSFRDENLVPNAEQVKNVLNLNIDLPNKSTFNHPWINNKKVANAGHTANVFGGNVPTASVLQGLDKEEQALYRIISLRTLGPMMPKGIDKVREYHAQVDEMPFKASRSCVDKKGWREVSELVKTQKKAEETAEFLDGGLKEVSFEVERIKRHPPVRITRTNLPKLMEKYGLGTPATQENIIKEMIEYGQIKFNGKYFEVTEVGKMLVFNQPLYTFESTKELGKRLLDIQGLGESNQPIPAGTAVDLLAKDIVKWKEDLLPRLPDSFSFFDAYEQKEKVSMTTAKGKNISFNQEFFGHRFSQDECERLLAGEEITFQGKNNKPVVGSLKRQKYKGKAFWGFMPNWDKEKYEKAKGIRG
jgi:DNA topoisomerase-3